MKAPDAKPVLTTCPACRDNLNSQRDVCGSGLKRTYLCELHRSMFDAADAREREREAKREVRS